MPRVARTALVVTLAVLSASEAHGGWPTPAAGASVSGDPEVLFTFDDGPHQKWSPAVLDALAAHHVQAIFFWVGRRVRRDRPVDRKRKALVARALDEGHLIGNHTINHLHLCATIEDERASEIDHNRSIYEELTHFPMVLFRTPYGDHCPRLIEMLRERSIEHLHWDIDAQEYFGRSSQSTAEYIIRKIKRLRGRGVVLMHDTQAATARALPLILRWIEEENLRRVEAGGHPIRVLSASDFVVERRHNELWTWWRTALSAARSRVSRALVGLIAGAPVPPALSRL